MYANQITQITTTTKTTIASASGSVSRVVGYISIYKSTTGNTTALIQIADNGTDYPADNITIYGTDAAAPNIGISKVQNRIVLESAQSLNITFAAATGGVTYTVIVHFEDQAE